MSSSFILEPYKEQVGGTTSFFSLPNGHLIKPVNLRELNFYKAMPSALLEITPQCCFGKEEGEKWKELRSSCGKCASMDLNSLDLENSLNSHSPNSDLAQIKMRPISPTLILMKNLTKGFLLPCTLDLKLGTRQHRDGAPEKKVISQTSKCQKSTSAALGLRLCGLSCQNKKGQKYFILKYEGRKMTTKELSQELERFFLTTGCCSKVLQEVRRIREVVLGLNQVRFYGASILIVTEADGSKVIAKLIDFANCSLSGGGFDNPGVDEGALFGLETLLSLLKNFE